MNNIITRDEARSLGLIRYFDGIPCKKGHIAERWVKKPQCVECARIHSSELYARRSVEMNAKRRERYKESPEVAIERATRYRKENAEKAREAGRQYYLANQERIKQKTRDWAASNRAAKNAYNKAWNAANKERARAHQREYDKRRIAADPVYAMMARMQCAIRNSLAKGGYTKRSRTFEYLGCTYEQFVMHLEKQFVRGMTWNNRNLWHIDHIIPTSSAQTEEEMTALHHFTNLRPLWAAENHSKSDKIEFLI